MNQHEAALIADLVAGYLQEWQDRHAPFRRSAEGQPREREAFSAFHDLLERLHGSLELRGARPDEREAMAFLCLMYPGAPAVVPPLGTLNELLSVLRCGFPRRSVRMKMLPNFVVAYGCGNWQANPTLWPEAAAAIARMVRFAAHNAQAWIRQHVFGAQQYAVNTAVVRAAARIGVKPLDIANTTRLAESLWQTAGVPVAIEADAQLHVEWDFGCVRIPALETVLNPGAKRIFLCRESIEIETPNGPLSADAGSRLVIAARERRFDIAVFRQDGTRDTRRIARGAAVVRGPAQLELLPCHCDSEACGHRHALPAWSPRTLFRLKIDAAPTCISFLWDGRSLRASGLGPRAFLNLRKHKVQLAFSGIVNRVPRLRVGAGPVAAVYEIRRYQRVLLDNRAGVLWLEFGAESVSIPAARSFQVEFLEKDTKPSMAFWRCHCNYHVNDPWIVPPSAEPDKPVELPSFVGSAVNGNSLPIEYKAFAKGMYFPFATDIGFDLEGRIHSGPIIQNVCVAHGAFEGNQCKCGARFDETSTLRKKAEDRIILIDIQLERQPPRYIDVIPPPYSVDDFLRCGQCGNYFQINARSFMGRTGFCDHVLARKSLQDRLTGAAANGLDLAAARVMEAMRAETNRCDTCPPGRPALEAVPWCPLPHARPFQEPPLPHDTTALWVRR